MRPRGFTLQPAGKHEARLLSLAALPKIGPPGCCRDAPVPHRVEVRRLSRRPANGGSPARRGSLQGLPAQRGVSV